MGWYGFNKPQGMTTTQIVVERVCPPSWLAENGYRVEAASCVKGVVYIAVNQPETEWTRRLYQPDAAGRVTWAMVVLTRTTKRRGQCDEFMYKDMTETMGPCEAECPMWILSKLSPPVTVEHDNRQSLISLMAWRTACEVKHIERKAAIKLRNGMNVKLAEPMSFRNGTRLQLFTVVFYPYNKKTRILFKGLDGAFYRIPKKDQLTMTEVIETPEVTPVVFEAPIGMRRKLL